MIPAFVEEPRRVPTRTWRRAPYVPSMIIGAARLPWKPLDAIDERYFGSEAVVLREQIHAGLAEIELRCQEQRHKARAALQCAPGELDGIAVALAVWRVGDDRIAA